MQFFFSFPVYSATNSLLVVSYLGYESVIVDLKNQTENFKIILKPSLNKLKTVYIDPNTKNYLRIFKEQFLGNSENARSTIIENENDIDFIFDKKSNTLSATSETPLIIINVALGYKINYQLVDFRVRFSGKNVDSAVSNLLFLGVSSYKMIDNTVLVKKRRKECYLGSNLHFFRCLAANNWKKANFEIYASNQQLHPEDIFTVSDTLNYRKVAVNGLKNFKIEYDDNQYSTISFRTPVFFVDLNGVNSNVNEIIITGAMGRKRFADMVPKNYNENE